MIFLDESGDDGKYVMSNSNFFIICVNSISEEIYKLEYTKLQKLLKRDKVLLKWYGLKDWQKDTFMKYSENTDYEVYAIWVNKNSIIEFDNLYYQMANQLFNTINKAEVVIYTGIHLKNMFEKLRRSLKANGKNYRFIEARSDELYGVSIADLWAGYLNHLLKNGTAREIPDKVKIIKYIPK